MRRLEKLLLEAWVSGIADIKEPKTDSMPAPDPAIPTVEAPAPMNLAADSISLLVGVVYRTLAWETAAWRATALW